MSGTRRPSGGRRWHETKGVRVKAARVVYLPDKSDPEDHLWTWAYEIHIENRRKEAITLRQRNWVIEYGDERPEETKSEYIDGQQPKLAPGGRFTYVSGVPLPKPSGRMGGWYLVETADGERFKAEIPAFELRAEKAILGGTKPRSRSKPAATDSGRLNGVSPTKSRPAAGQSWILERSGCPRGRNGISKGFF
jgi:ApaG protein